MSRRYSKRVREEAALICAIAASGNRAEGYEPITRTLDLEYDCYDLALSAWKYALHWYRDRLIEVDTMSPLLDAEAECLIRCGWSPGD